MKTVLVSVPEDLCNRLVEAWEYGQFADDFDYPLAKRIRADVRTLCNTLAENVAQTDEASDQAKLAESQNRLFDVLLGDDAQAWKEAERYLERERRDLYSALIASRKSGVS
ncbi:hypothetical protein [Methyloversatilis sp.]|uniref:hypothetical protein n=1 Tax=Methyloversatilis sp. TaxID=2569862 RepID=UPI0035AE651A